MILTSLRIDVAAAASGGATSAPRVTATAHGIAGISQRAVNATANVVTITAIKIRLVTGNQLALKSRREVSNAASSSTGATNKASAKSGLREKCGPFGKSA